MRIAKTSFIALLIILCSCQKDPNVIEEDISKHLLETEYDRIVKKEQAINMYDATALDDSASFVNPPTDKYYQWNVVPDDGCLAFWGKYKYGLAHSYLSLFRYLSDFCTYLRFCFQIRLIAATDTLEVEVTQDVLYSSQPIKSDDILNLRPSIAKTWNDPHHPNTDPPDEVFLYLIYSTTEKYEYNAFEKYVEFAPSVGANNYSVIFSDSVKLGSYPFSNANGSFYTVHGRVDLRGLSLGVTANLTIGWLGKTYTGKVTLINKDQYSFEWDNTGSVKIN